jgi:hypothetical protein
MSLAAGVRLGSYDILGLIGAGGSRLWSSHCVQFGAVR